MATRRHGQHGALYVDISSAANGSAVPVATISEHQVQFVTAKQEVTAYEDANKVYVSGKPDASGSYKGFLDTSTDQLYYAATGGQGRKFYHYVDTVNDATKYFFGTAIFDMTITQTVTGSVDISGTWAASGVISRTWV